MEILNSKSEYSRCQIPRLTIDMEGWKANNLPAKKVLKPKESTKDAEDEEMKVIEIMEDNSRRMDMKRKSEEIGKKRCKKMKFERLEGWGEA